ncbi:hypothetical protein FGW37_14655 [Streptomyces rectiverticillatus]|nr:hypothetical protein FGW37_14655 [Streptomyces rectiverticillatus]
MAAAVAVVVIGGAVGGGILLAKGKDDGKRDAARIEDTGSVEPAPPTAAPSSPPSPSPSASASASPSASASASPSASESASASPSPSGSASSSAPAAGGSAPAGYENVSAPQGFSLAVPQGWRREDKGSGQIDYAGRTGSEYLRIGIVHGTKQSAYDHFQDLEKGVAQLNGYKRVKMTRNTFQGRPGALWEWTWVDKSSGGTMHGYNQAYVDGSGTEYAIMFRGRDGGGDAYRKPFDTALGSWRAG